MCFLWIRSVLVGLTIKLSKEDILRVFEDPYHLFLQGIRSSVTREKYVRKLKLFVCVTLEDQLVGDAELRSKQREKKLASGNKKEIESFLDTVSNIKKNGTAGISKDL